MTLREFIIKKYLTGALNLEGAYMFKTMEDYVTFWGLVHDTHKDYYGSTKTFFKYHPEYLEVTKLDRYLYADNQ